MKQVAANQRQGNRQQAQDFAGTQRMFAENFQHVRQQGDSGTKQKEPGNIERVGLFLAVVGQMQIHHKQTDDPYWNVHEENKSPVQIADDQSAGNRSQHGANQSGNRYEAHDPNEFGFGKRSNQRKPAHGHHHRSAASLQNAASHQQMNIV